MRDVRPHRQTCRQKAAGMEDVLTITNLVFISGINCMETMPCHDRAKRMQKHLNL